jgi:hypothetical protein
MRGGACAHPPTAPSTPSPRPFPPPPRPLPPHPPAPTHSPTPPHPAPPTPSPTHPQLGSGIIQIHIKGLDSTRPEVFTNKKRSMHVAAQVNGGGAGAVLALAPGSAARPQPARSACAAPTTPLQNPHHLPGSSHHRLCPPPLHPNQVRFRRPVVAADLCIGQEMFSELAVPLWLSETLLTLAAKTFSNTTRVSVRTTPRCAPAPRARGGPLTGARARHGACATPARLLQRTRIFSHTHTHTHTCPPPQLLHEPCPRGLPAHQRVSRRRGTGAVGRAGGRAPDASGRGGGCPFEGGSGLGYRV